MSDDTSRLEALVVPVLTENGLALYDLTVTGQGKSRTIRVSVERADGGPLELDAIASASRSIDPILEEDSTLTGAYTLEVSSPGLERPLRRPDHFRRARGQVISCKIPGNARLRGVLMNADDTGFDLDVEGAAQRIAYADVTNVRTVFEWGADAPSDARTGPRKEKSKR